jgi:hypothetical protein
MAVVFSKLDRGLFAVFCAFGLSMSLAAVFVYDLRIEDFWI